MDSGFGYEGSGMSIHVKKAPQKLWDAFIIDAG